MAEIVPIIQLQFFDNNGDPLSGGKIYCYEAGTTTLKATYKDLAGAEANTNPIILDSSGRPPFDVRIINGVYKFIIKDSNDNTLETYDDVQSFSSLTNTSGALAILNDLSDLNSVPTALINLGISPLSTPVTTTITNGMSATTISGYTFTPGSWVHVEYFVTRNSAGTLGSGTVDLHYDGADWQIVPGQYHYKSGKSSDHGLTFSMSTNSLQVASDSSGTGSLITKYHKV